MAKVGTVRSVLGFIEIPAGPFMMGSDKGEDLLTSDDETPQHVVELPTFFIGRWPVTVSQFAAFVADRAGNRGFVPGDPRCLEAAPNRPVVYVSWHEALAYCGWLTTKLRDQVETCGPLAALLRNSDLTSNPTWRVTLPSEAEWEKAARGPEPARSVFPWGNSVDPQKANYTETRIGTVCAVGCFPGGQSPFQVEDLAGNVWEWTRTLMESDSLPLFSYPYEPDYEGTMREDLKAGHDIFRVARGGGFNSAAADLRTAFRDGANPSRRGRGVGFRVVVSPFSPRPRQLSDSSRH